MTKHKIRIITNHGGSQKAEKVNDIPFNEWINGEHCIFRQVNKSKEALMALQNFGLKIHKHFYVNRLYTSSFVQFFY